MNADYGIKLMDYGARWYDPAIGRFTTVDPLAETYSFQSPFAYAANNPVSNIDLFGMAPASTEDLIVSAWAQGTGTYDNTGRRTDNNDEESTEEDCCPGLGIGGAQARSQNAQAIAETTEGSYESSYLELSKAEVQTGVDGALLVLGEWALVKTGTLVFRWVKLSGGIAKKSNSIWTATKSKSAVQNAFSHWKKHAAEFPEYLNAKQYVEGTKRFLTNSPKGTLTKIRPNGDILKYHPESNTFGVMNSNGVPRTMFRPTDGIKYWLKQ